MQLNETDLMNTYLKKIILCQDITWIKFYHWQYDVADIYWKRIEKYWKCAPKYRRQRTCHSILKAHILGYNFRVSFWIFLNFIFRTLFIQIFRKSISQNTTRMIFWPLLKFYILKNIRNSDFRNIWQSKKISIF